MSEGVPMSGDVAVDHGAAAAAMGGQNLADEKPKPARKRCRSCGQLRPTKWRKCERCRKADDYDRIHDYWQTTVEEARNLLLKVRKLEAEAAKPPAHPNYFHISKTAWDVSDARLSQIVAAIAPAADIFPMEWHPSKNPRYPNNRTTVIFDKQEWSMNDANLRRALAAVEKIPEVLKVDYGRRE